MKKRLIYLAVAIMALISTSLNAQVTTSSMSGTVTDNTNEALVGATIKAVHTTTGSVYGTTTRLNGSYNLPNMRIGGPYTIEITYVGFQKNTYNGIFLSLGEDFTLNSVLKDNSVTLDAVEITATRNEVTSSNRTGAQEIINSERMTRLPSINRSLNDFTKLTPMSSGNNFGGTSYRYNNVTVDGASFNNSFGLSSSLGASGTEPISLEALEQVQVMIAPFDVRNGSFTGASINSVTKSGTNNLNASVYMFTKSPSMRGYRQNNDIVPVTEFSNKSYGLSIGGPIIKNKLFYYINAEIDRQEVPITYRPRPNKTTPVTGNYSAADEETLKDLSEFMLTNFNYNTGSYNVTKTPTKADRITARLDWNINAKNVLSLKYFYLKSFNTNSPSTSGALTNGRGPNAFAIPYSSSYYRTNNNFNIVMMDLNTTINSSMSNTLKVGYSALRDFRDMDGGFFPEVNIGDGNGNALTTFGTEANSYNNQLNSDIIQIQDNFLWNIDNHQITVGTQSDYRSFLNGYARDFAGMWQYKSVQDFKDDVNAFKNNTAGYTSKASSYRQAYSLQDEFPFAKVDVLTLGFYLQDKWTVIPKLNVTYGVRVDLPIFMNELQKNGRIDTITYQGGRKIDVSKLPATAPLFSPRIGINYDVLGDRSLVVRGGTGLFSGTPPYVWLSNQSGNNGLLFANTTTKRPFDGVTALPKPASSVIPTASISVTDPNFKYPQLWKSNLAVDFKFGDGWIATAEFLYNKDVNAIYHMNIALPDYTSTKVFAMKGADNRPIFAAKTIDAKVSDVVLMSNTSKGYSMYGTLQLQKDFKQGALKGLYVNGSFTMGEAKGVTDGSSSVAFSAWRYRPAVDPNAEELGFMAGSFPARGLLQVSYKKDWSKYYSTSVGVIYQKYSPFRYSYTYNGDLNGDGAGTENDLMFVPATKDQIILVKDGTSDTRTTDQIWDQLNAFISQDPYLSKMRGKYSERNGGVAAYVDQIDLNLTHDINLYFKNGKSNTLRFSFDVMNFANLLNKNWGVQSTTVLGNQQYQLLKLVGKPTATAEPTFTMPLVNGAPLTNTFKDNIGSGSRWQMQFGIKYILN